MQSLVHVDVILLDEPADDGRGQAACTRRRQLANQAGQGMLWNPILQSNFNLIHGLHSNRVVMGARCY
ncbi:Uncharacterised protein [Vibrio cholerae]|nr:hypothetical protein DN43_3264 [Vibrio cholerae]CSD22568.1 Uncharacterised protein [Vibrio cholerae]